MIQKYILGSNKLPQLASRLCAHSATGFRGVLCLKKRLKQLGIAVYFSAIPQIADGDQKERTTRNRV